MQQGLVPLKTQKNGIALTADPAVFVYSSAEEGSGRGDLILSILQKCEKVFANSEVVAGLSERPGTREA